MAMIPGDYCGQGTIGLEIAAQVPDLDAIIVPIGGAGLIAGSSGGPCKHSKPNATVIGVEPERAASYTAALAAGKTGPNRDETNTGGWIERPKVGRKRVRAIARELVARTVLVRGRGLRWRCSA